MRRVAGIVTFWPDLEQLMPRVAALACASERVVVFANSPVSQTDRARLLGTGAGDGGIEIVQSPDNVGLGRAYNHILQYAQARGADAVLLADQDSDIEPETVEVLAARMVELTAAGHRVAVVGALPVAPDGSPTRFKTTRLFERSVGSDLPNTQAVDFAISSGSLVSLAAYEAVGPFREDFFIDAIDIEWCFRAWHAGLSCWTAMDAPMPHRLGQGGLEIPLTRLKLAQQPPSRLYTYVRNQVRMLGLRHVPMRWKLKILPYIGLQAAAYALKGNKRRASLSAIGRGFRDGIRLALREPGNSVSPAADASGTAPLEKT
ncbi:glycosyltransferase [Hyphomicrobium sp. CS1GBMeth3]|uniref:glycosyltransferase n=1 Tax=Hyphomicrobium sp. CS1GBMeth3 TaxID=1892845 RepID=UPI000931587D|nr:glycosyltransferase [Hyphomicrobium sp. CS1GBMeth3]